MSSWCHAKRKFHFYRWRLVLDYVLSNISRLDNMWSTCHWMSSRDKNFVYYMSLKLAKIYKISRSCLGHFSVFQMTFLSDTLYRCCWGFLSEMSAFYHHCRHILSEMVVLYRHRRCRLLKSEARQPWPHFFSISCIPARDFKFLPDQDQTLSLTLNLILVLLTWNMICTL